MGEGVEVDTNALATMLADALNSSKRASYWDGFVNVAMDKIREGKNREVISRELHLNKKISYVIYDLAMSRLKCRVKFSGYRKLWLDTYSSRYSTPEQIGLYRAERLKGNSITDIGTGAGMQAIFMAKFSRVVGVEINKPRYLMSLLNSSAYDWNPPKFNLGDFHENAIKRTGSQVIFSDPLRPPTEQERGMGNLSPNPAEIMDFYGSETDNFVFDLPPQLKRENIEFDEFESEYISMDGSINRFTIYMGSVRRKNFSAVMLPQMIRFESDAQEDFKEISRFPGKYLLSVDPAFIYAGLEGNISNIYDLSFLYRDKRRVVLTSDSLKENFPGEQFQILRKSSEDNLLNNLISLEAGKVIPRYNPGEGYYEFRNNIEEKLSGKEKLYLFNFQGEILICIKL